jgi:exonuclease III
MSSKLDIFSTNIRSLINPIKTNNLLNHISDFLYFSNNYTYHNLKNLIIAVQETWLYTEHKIPSFKFIQNNRININKRNRSGGVAFIISKNLNVTIRSDLNRNLTKMEILAIELPEYNLVLINYYQSKKSNQLLDHINELINQIELEHKQFILMGDSNIRHTAWSSTRNDREGIKMYNLITNKHLSIYNPKAHTIIHNSGFSDSIDQIFGTIPHLQAKIISFSQSDHALIHLPINFQSKLKQYNKKDKWQFPSTTTDLTKTQWERFQQKLKQKFEQIAFLGLYPDINEAVKLLTDTIIQTHQEVLLNINIKRKQQRQRNFWYNKNIAREIRKKHRLMRNFQKTKDPIYKERLITQSRLITKLVREAKNNSWTLLINRFKTSMSPKEIWKLFKFTCGNKQPKSIPTFFCGNQNLKGKANSINNYFKQMGSPKYEIASFQNIYEIKLPTIQNLNFEPITNEEITQIINFLPKGKSPGPDNISNEIIKNLPTAYISIITQLFNNSLNTQQIPNIWKQAIINPIPKKSNPLEPKDFRPISLISNLGKLLEKIVSNRITEEITQRNLTSPNQYGFRRNISCNHALATFITSIQHNLHQSRNGSSAILLDLKSAYDSVNHQILIQRMNLLNLNHTLIKWTEEFLSNRQSQTKIPINLHEFILSDIQHFDRGVPQGSPLSPLLFNIFINPISDIINNSNIFNTNVHHILYADDLIIWCNNLNPAEAKRQLQHTLDLIINFLESNELRVNTQKCQSIGFANQINTKNIWHGIKYIINNEIIPNDDNPRYLGLYLDSHLSWNFHIKHITNIAKQRLQLIKRITSKNNGPNAQFLCNLFKTFLLPATQYGATIWNNTIHIHRELIKLETVYNQAIKTVLGTLPLTPNLYQQIELNQLPFHLQLEQHTATFLYTTSKTQPHILQNIINNTPNSPLTQFYIQLLTKYNINIVPQPPIIQNIPFISTPTKEDDRYIFNKTIKKKAHKTISPIIISEWKQIYLNSNHQPHYKTINPNLGRRRFHWKLGLPRKLEVCFTQARLGVTRTMDILSKLYPNTYPLNHCRLCHLTTETIHHVLILCPALHSQRSSLLNHLNYYLDIQPNQLSCPLLLGDSHHLIRKKRIKRTTVFKYIILFFKQITQLFTLI